MLEQKTVRSAPCDKRQLEINLVVDLLHGRHYQLLQTVSGVGAFAHDVRFQRNPILLPERTVVQRRPAASMETRDVPDIQPTHGQIQQRAQQEEPSQDAAGAIWTRRRSVEMER